MTRIESECLDRILDAFQRRSDQLEQESWTEDNEEQLRFIKSRFFDDVDSILVSIEQERGEFE